MNSLAPILLLLISSYVIASNKNLKNVPTKASHKKLKYQNSKQKQPKEIVNVDPRNQTISPSTSSSSFSSSSSSSSSLIQEMAHITMLCDDIAYSELEGLEISQETQESEGSENVFDEVTSSSSFTFEPFANIESSEVPIDGESKEQNIQNFLWNVHEESKVTLKQIEFRQLCITTSFPKFKHLATDPEFNLFPGNRFEFSRDWPDVVAGERPSELFCRFQMLAAKLILLPGNVFAFKQLLSLNLVDLSRPVYDSNHQVYRSFLSILLENDPIDAKKLDTLLEFCPKNILNRANTNNVRPLEVAVRKKSLDLVRKLIEAGAEIDCSSFMRAVRNSDLPIIDYFLGTGRVDPNFIIRNGVINIHHALNHLGIEYVRKILSINTSRYHVDPRAFTILLNSLHSKKLEALRIVASIAAGSSMNKNIRIPLLLLFRNVVVQNDLETARFLRSIKVPIDINYQYSFSRGIKLIHYAATEGHLEMVNLFLEEFGENVDCLSGTGFSVLEIAMLNKRYHLVAELIGKGAKFGLSNIIKNAIRLNNSEIITALLSTSEDLNNFILSNGHNLITQSIASDRPELLEIILSSQRINPFLFDNLGKSIYNMTLPEDASEQLKLIVENEIKSSLDLIMD